MLSQLIARSVLAVGLFVCLSLQLLGQSSVSPEQMYHKVWAVVPMVGTGKPNDPRRPMLIPSPAEMAADQQAREASAKPDPSDSTGKRKVLSPPDLVGVSMQIGDDGNTALVEFTFLNPAAFHNF